MVGQPVRAVNRSACRGRDASDITAYRRRPECRAYGPNRREAAREDLAPPATQTRELLDTSESACSWQRRMHPRDYGGWA